MIVHVRVHNAGGRSTCHSGIVLTTSRNEPLLIRVFLLSPIGSPVGASDTEAYYPRYATRFNNPDGTKRESDSWHPVEWCDLD